ncbi:hypothetical protein AMS68_003112 [Peltaster fructicola]|uniref:Uncharacterized protein n=1 Tax=Peltaster fructicola TaxID=286661 RepID=A0A6H0XSH9_9PEZI|nr:hypothetical protein AMS68_003112 [Peltaster fructicola]
MKSFVVASRQRVWTLWILPASSRLTQVCAGLLQARTPRQDAEHSPAEGPHDLRRACISKHQTELDSDRQFPTVPGERRTSGLVRDERQLSRISPSLPFD